MNGTIKWVSDAMTNKRNELYKTVTFQMEDGTRPKTYITPKMKNYAQWKPLLTEGTVIGGLRLKREGLIDADSPVFPIK
jgi:hypothetical protein